MPFFWRKPATDGLGRTLSASKRSWVRATFRNPHTPTGLVLGEHEQGTAVIGVLPSSLAEQQGVPVGGLILTVNGEEVVGLPPEAVEVLIETEHWPITINVRKPHAEEVEAARGFEVEFVFPAGALGIALVTNAGGTFVGRISGGSLSDMLGVPVGALVLEVNDENVMDLDSQMVQAMIVSAPRPIKIRMRLPPGVPIPEPADPPAAAALVPSGGHLRPRIKVITATFAGQGHLGLVLGDSPLGGVRVNGVAAGSMADAQMVPDGALIIGINEEDVRALDKQIVQAMLKSAPRPFTLHLEINADLLPVSTPVPPPPVPPPPPPPLSAAVERQERERRLAEEEERQLQRVLELSKRKSQQLSAGALAANLGQQQQQQQQSSPQRIAETHLERPSATGGSAPHATPSAAKSPSGAPRSWEILGAEVINSKAGKSSAAPATPAPATHAAIGAYSGSVMAALSQAGIVASAFGAEDEDEQLRRALEASRLVLTGRPTVAATTAPATPPAKATAVASARSTDDDDEQLRRALAASALEAAMLAAEDSSEPVRVRSPEPVRVRFTEKGSLGLVLVNHPERPGTIVKLVTPASVAAAHGVQPGSELLELNGESMRGLDFEMSMVLIGTAGRPLTLLMQPPRSEE
jgi:hypothetical protein